MPVKLRIEFCGLCLFVVTKDRSRVSVLMPDARRRPNVDAIRHADNTPAVPHAGYLRFDLADLRDDTPGASANGDPVYEVVHRFDREVLHLGLDAPKSKVDVDELLFPNFGEIHSDLVLKPDMFSAQPPQELLMRTTLTGGSFTSHSGGSNWTFPKFDPDAAAPYQGQFANYVVWTGEIAKSPLQLSITSFDKGHETHFELRPRNGIIRLKIANLCAENPLEWPELKIRTIAGQEDLDFKWLYRLMKDPAVVLPYPDSELPVPMLDRTGGVAGIDQDCTGGQIDCDH